jgi:TonB-dependent receptor
MFGGSYDWNARGYDDVEPAPGTTSVRNGDFANGVPVFFGEDVRQYWYDRTRFGFATSADYKLGNDSFFYLRGIFSQFKDNGQDWIYTPNISNYTSATTSAPTNMVFNHVFRSPFQQIFNVTLGAQHTIGSNLVGYEVSGGQARYSGGFPRAVFNTPGGIIFGLDTTDPLTPKFHALNGVNIFDPTTYALSQVQYNSMPISERDFTGNIWLTHQYKIGTRFGAFETGFKVRDAQKTRKSTQLFYNFNGNAKMSQFLQSYVNSDYYFWAYQVGPTTDWNKINSFYLANSSTLFTPDSNRSHRAGDSNNFSLSERVYAGCVMNTITIGRVRLQGGVRFEGTQGSFVGTQANFDPNGNFISDSRVPGEQSYLDVLPSVQLLYNLNGSTNIRAAYGRGIARPNFGDLPPFANLDQGGVGGTTRVTTGNPALVPTHANDFDLLFEHYLKSVGIIQAGWFYKDLSDPIYNVQTVPTTGQYAGFKVTQKINGPGAHITGVEMAWQQHLTFLPGLLNGMGVSANYSYTTSQASFPTAFGRTDKPALIRQAPNNWNFDTTYDKGPIAARMGLTHNDANIFAYNFSDGAPGGIRGPNGDVYLYPHTQVDAQVMYRLPRFRDFQVVASFLNLNNEVFGFYQGSEQYPLQREYYKTTYSFGLRWTPSFGK